MKKVPIKDVSSQSSNVDDSTSNMIKEVYTPAALLVKEEEKGSRFLSPNPSIDLPVKDSGQVFCKVDIVECSNSESDDDIENEMNNMQQKQLCVDESIVQKMKGNDAMNRNDYDDNELAMKELHTCQGMTQSNIKASTPSTEAGQDSKREQNNATNGLDDVQINAS
eukprot:4256789-Ditylum_brightwellii.AAC.1